MCFQPLTTSWGRGASAQMFGVLQVAVSSRRVRQTSFPSARFRAATNPFVSTSHCTNTRSPWIIGELAKPHSRSAPLGAEESDEVFAVGGHGAVGMRRLGMALLLRRAFVRGLVPKDFPCRFVQA